MGSLIDWYLIPVVVTILTLCLLLPSTRNLWLERSHLAARWLVRLIVWLRLEPIVYLTLVARKAKRESDAAAYRRWLTSAWLDAPREIYFSRFMGTDMGSHAGDAVRFSLVKELAKPEAKLEPVADPYLPKDPPPQVSSQGHLGVPKRQIDLRKTANEAAGRLLMAFSPLIEECKAAILPLRSVNEDLLGRPPRPRKPSTSSSRVSGPGRTRKPRRKPASPVRRRKKG